MRLLLLLYAAGLVVALVKTDAPAPSRVGLAVLWPLAIAAFAVTIAVLVLVAAIAFPIVGIALAVAAVAAYWLA